MNQFKTIESVRMHAKNKGHGEKNQPWSGQVGEENGPTCSIYIPGNELLAEFTGV